MDADKYEVLSFDCIRTLVDWEGGIVSGLRPVLRAHGVGASDDEILDLHAGPSTDCSWPRRRAAMSSTAMCSVRRFARRAGGGVRAKSL